MSIADDLPSELTRRLQEEADQRGVTLIQHITRILQARTAINALGPLEAHRAVSAERRVSEPMTLAECFASRTPIGPVETREVDAPDRGSLRERVEARRQFLEANRHRMLEAGNER